MGACVRACVHAFFFVCVWVGVCVCGWVGAYVCMRVRQCVLAHAIIKCAQCPAKSSSELFLWSSHVSKISVSSRPTILLYFPMFSLA